MNMILRAATPAERLYAYGQSKHINERCGNPGYLQGKLDDAGTGFFSHWETSFSKYNTSEFEVEFNTVLEMLRLGEQYQCALKNRTTMISYCLDHPESRIGECQEYAYRADTGGYTYLIRCIPNTKDNHVYIYPYRRDLFDRHMKQAEKGIRFLTPNGKEKFRIPDGESIQITTSGAGTRSNTVRYVDAHHFLIVTPYDSYFYHIHEFPEWLERHDGKVIPLRSTLPDKCYNVLPSGDEIIIVNTLEKHQREQGQRIGRTREQSEDNVLTRPRNSQ